MSRVWYRMAKRMGNVTYVIFCLTFLTLLYRYNLCNELFLKIDLLLWIESEYLISYQCLFQRIRLLRFWRRISSLYSALVDIEIIRILYKDRLENTCLKGLMDKTLSNPSLKDWNVRFTMVHLNVYLRNSYIMNFHFSLQHKSKSHFYRKTKVNYFCCESDMPLYKWRVT